MNFFECTVDGSSAKIGDAIVPLDQATADKAKAAGGSLKLGIRPMYVGVHEENVENGVPAEVSSVEDQGYCKIITCKFNGSEIKARIKDNRKIPTGTCWLTFPKDKTKLYSNERLVRTGATMNKWENNKAWFLVLPVFVIVAFSAIIPLMTVVNYSVQDIFGPGQRFFVGVEWFREVLLDERLHDALFKQLSFSTLVLLIEMPLGIGIGLMMPKKGWTSSACLVILALPLLIPWNVIGTIWIIFTRPDIGLFGAFINATGIPFDHTASGVDAWITLMLMEVWHWTPLVALLAYAGLRAIPEAFYQAAKIDGASSWAIFKYIQLPKLRGVMTIACCSGSWTHS